MISRILKNEDFRIMMQILAILAAMVLALTVAGGWEVFPIFSLSALGAILLGTSVAHLHAALLPRLISAAGGIALIYAALSMATPDGFFP